MRRVGLSLAAVAILAVSVLSAPTTSSAVAWRTYHDSRFGFALRYPAAWHLTPLNAACGNVFGVMVSNTAHPFHQYKQGVGCSWPPTGSIISPGAVVVAVSNSFAPMIIPGRPARRPTTFIGLERVGPVRWIGAVSFAHGLAHHLSVWITPGASPVDRTFARQVIASLRPWPLAHPG
jgi:hypothetical protein